MIPSRKEAIKALEAMQKTKRIMSKTPDTQSPIVSSSEFRIVAVTDLQRGDLLKLGGITYTFSRITNSTKSNSVEFKLVPDADVLPTETRQFTFAEIEDFIKAGFLSRPVYKTLVIRPSSITHRGEVDPPDFVKDYRHSEGREIDHPGGRSFRG